MSIPPSPTELLAVAVGVAVTLALVAIGKLVIWLLTRD
jgi:hypothetical protein